MANQLSDAGFKELVGHEAIVLTRYLDSVGVWTLGVGHTRSAGKPDPQTFMESLTVQEALDLFKSDLKKYQDAVASIVKVPVSQTEFDALVSFHYNTGGIKSASLVKSLNAGDRKTAAEQFMNWIKPKSVIERRKKEQTLFATGVYSNGGKATIYPASPTGKVQWKNGTRISL